MMVDWIIKMKLNIPNGLKSVDKLDSKTMEEIFINGFNKIDIKNIFLPEIYNGDALKNNEDGPIIIKE